MTDALKYVREIATGEIIRSVEQDLLLGLSHKHVNISYTLREETFKTLNEAQKAKEANGSEDEVIRHRSLKEGYEDLTQDEINSIIFPELKEVKRIQIKAFRNQELLKNEAQIIGDFQGTNLEGVKFKISKEDKPELISITLTMTDEEIRGWNDAEGVRRQLTKSNFNSILKELNIKDDIAYNQENLKLQIINSISPSETKTYEEAIEEVKNFEHEKEII